MPKIAFLFPGQGSQAVGMAREVAERHDEARRLVERADEVLGTSLKGLMFEGPEETLKQTENTQPALYIASAATLAVLRGAGIAPAAVAGHSLGEYTALYAAGVFDYETGLRLVRTRGLAFAEAGKARPGAMAAIIGLDNDNVEELCRAVSSPGSVAVCANFNDPSQTVISGDPPAVAAACDKCKEAGAKRALPLPVSGAFHSPLVEPAADTMRRALAESVLAAPGCTFVNNVDATVLTDPTAIADSLVRQVTSSVRWVGCVQRLVAEGTEAFVEVGSGKVLAGLCRRIAKDIPCHTTDTWEAVEKTIEVLR
ncbi:MAG: ACP S-malonyltransferase [Candidatus Sumerlaeia bacterium]|nr:ACP S-malonyltransferase [Candidatus Sumerlaeia bacterium]